jgi:glycosyltransferase involved in cell wall biosynthesis
VPSSAIGDISKCDFLLHSAPSRYLVDSSKYPVHTLDAQKTKIEAALYHPSQKYVQLSGFTTDLSITRVQVILAGQRVGTTRTYIASAGKSGDTLRMGFWLQFRYVRDESVEALTTTVECFAGERLVSSHDARLRETEGGAPPRDARPIRYEDGFLWYEFASARRSSRYPWIILAAGMPLWPSTSGGQSRTLSVSKYLRRHGYRTVLVAGEPLARFETYAREIAEFADAVVLLPQRNFDQEAEQLSVRLWARHNPELAVVLEALDAHYRARACIVNFAFNHYAARRLKASVIIDTHDIQHTRAELAEQSGGDLEDRRCGEEAWLLGQADALIAIQAGEQSQLETMAPGKPVIVVPHSWEPNAATEPVGAENLHRLLYVGQKYDPNILGLREFLRVAWPEVRQAVPNAELHVAGRVCDAFSDVQDPAIIFHGVVDSLDGLYTRCGILINPTPYGSGLKIKTVEGLLFGRCVVATPAGALGIPAGAPMLITGIEGFARAIAKLNADPAAAVALAEAGKAFAEEAFSPRKIYQPLSELLAGLPKRLAKSETRITLGAASLRIVDTNVEVDATIPGLSQAHAFLAELVCDGAPMLRSLQLVRGEGGVVGFRMGIPIALFDGRSHTIEIQVDGKPIGSVRARLSRERCVRRYFIAENAYARGTSLFPEVSVIARAVTTAAAGTDHLREIITVNGRRVVGRAVTFPRIGRHRPSEPATLRIMVPDELPKRINSQSELHDLGSGAFVGEAASADFQAVAAPAPRVASVMASPDVAWLPGWPLSAAPLKRIAITRKAAKPSFWIEEGPTGLRIAAPFRFPQPLSEIRLIFPPRICPTNVPMVWSLVLRHTPLVAAELIREKTAAILRFVPQAKTVSGIVWLEARARTSPLLDAANRTEIAMPLAIEIVF